MAQSLACTIDETGISAPSYAEILLSLQDSYRSIFGSDVVLDPDTQDGQFLAIMALAISDTNALAIAIFNGFRPSFSVGVPLSSLIKINGLKRKIATFSTATVRIVGVAGTIISNGAVDDTNGHRWLLPSIVTIPVEGEITVGVVASEAGAITAGVATITDIATPTPGWQTVSNPATAAPGAPVESDAALRLRQSLSTAIAAHSPAAAVLAAVLSQAGVTRARLYENDTDSADSNGVPPHSICLVIEGGVPANIAPAIAWTKGPGCGTFGTVRYVATDPLGVPVTVEWTPLTQRQVYFRVVIQPLHGYLSTIGDAVLASITAYLNGLGIGERVYHNRIWSAANLQGDAATSSTSLTQIQLDQLSNTFTVISITLSIDNINFAPDDILIAFTEASVADSTSGTLSTYP